MRTMNLIKLENVKTTGDCFFFTIQFFLNPSIGLFRGQEKVAKHRVLIRCKQKRLENATCKDGRFLKTCYRFVSTSKDKEIFVHHS